MVKSYTINEKRLKETENKFQKLKQAVSLLVNVAKAKPSSGDEASTYQKINLRKKGGD